MARRDDKAKKDKSLPGEAQELFQLVVGYAKQETLDPVRNLGRFLALGMAGALLGSLGAVLLLLGGLRLLQTETGDAFDGNWNFVPYLVVLVVSGAIAGGAIKARSRGQRRDAR
ncbi:MAG TPA: hypothetical protein VNT52_06915 [Acidimicrobiales bacterium]|nr:hypothetical protein [Acidimicrobiales bacterium]